MSVVCVMGSCYFNTAFLPDQPVGIATPVSRRCDYFVPVSVKSYLEMFRSISSKHCSVLNVISCYQRGLGSPRFSVPCGFGGTLDGSVQGRWDWPYRFACGYVL